MPPDEARVPDHKTRDRVALISRLREEVIRQIAINETGYEVARDACCEADGPMQSRYDTVRKQKSALAGGYAHRLASLQRGLQALDAVTGQRTPGRVTVGSLVDVSIAPMEDKEHCLSEAYLIVPSDVVVGVDTLEEEGISVVTEVSPVGRALVGSEVGQVLTIQLPAGRVRMHVRSTS